MKKPTPTYGRTPDQDNVRNLFREGCDAWNLLSSEDKQQWNNEAAPLNLTGFNLFIRDWFDVTVTYCPCVDDAYVRQESPDWNYGLYPELKIKNRTGMFVRLLAKFDVTEIPADSDIISAILSLYYYQLDNADPAWRKLTLRRITQSWDESSVTWNNKPNVSGVKTAEITAGTPPGWREFNVKSDVQDFVNGTKTNYGWYCWIEAGSESYWSRLWFWAKERGSLIPTLEVAYR